MVRLFWTHGRFAVELWRFCGGIIEVLSCISGGFEIGLLWFCGGIMRWDYGGFVMVSHELPRHDHHASGLNQQLVQCHVGPPKIGQLVPFNWFYRSFWLRYCLCITVTSFI